MFAGIGVREPQANASEAFTQFGEAHREVERFAIKMLQTVKPVSISSGLMGLNLSNCSFLPDCKSVSCFLLVILLYFHPHSVCLSKGL